MKNTQSQNKYLFRTLILSLFVLIGCKKSEDTITLIPDGFTGSIKIWFNQKDGHKKEYEGEKRLYIIPTNGVLKTNFDPQFGYHFSEFYYVEENGQRKKIPALLDFNENILDTLDQSKVYAYRFLSLGDVVKVDSLGIVTEKRESGINFMVGNPE